MSTTSFVHSKLVSVTGNITSLFSTKQLNECLHVHSITLLMLKDTWIVVILTGISCTGLRLLKCKNFTEYTNHGGKKENHYVGSIGSDDGYCKSLKGGIESANDVPVHCGWHVFVVNCILPVMRPSQATHAAFEAKGLRFHVRERPTRPRLQHRCFKIPAWDITATNAIIRFRVGGSACLGVSLRYQPLKAFRSIGKRLRIIDTRSEMSDTKLKICCRQQDAGSSEASSLALFPTVESSCLKETACSPSAICE